MTIPIKSPCEESAALATPSALQPCRGPWVLIVSILASSMAFIDGTAVNVALPALQTALHATRPSAKYLRCLRRGLRRRVEPGRHNYFRHHRKGHYAGSGCRRRPRFAYDHGGAQRSPHISVFPARWAAFFLSESTRESRYLSRVTRCEARTTKLPANTLYIRDAGLCGVP